MVTQATNTPRESSILEEAAGTVSSLARALRKHWPLVVAAVLLGAGGALVYAKTQPRVYEAISMVEIDSHAPQPLGEKSEGNLQVGAGMVGWDSRPYYETQYKIITSSQVLSDVVRALGLANDYDFMGYAKPPEFPPSVESVASVLKGRVTVSPIKYSYLILLKVEDRDPRRAKRICDAIASAYMDLNLGNALSATSDAVTWLNGQIDHLKQGLEQDENALHDFKERNALPSTSINEESNMLRVEMQEFDTALAHTRTRRAELEARHAELSKVTSDNPDQLPASELLTNLFLGNLRNQYQEAVKDRVALLGEGKGDNHPLVKRAMERSNQAKAALLAEVKNIQGAVESDLAIVKRQEAGELALFDEARGRAVDLNMKEIEYHRLDRTREQDEKLYNLLLERSKEADLARMMRVNNVRVVEVAPVPRAPVRPRVPLYVGIGLFAGLLLGAIVSWVREQLDASLKTPDDVENKLGVTFLGLLPEIRNEDELRYAQRRRRRRARSLPSKEAGELTVHLRPLSGVAEAARAVRTNLTFMNPDRPYRTLLVTSAAPSEGKTTVACSIAIALAQGGQRVCMIDCDLRRPRLHRIFDRAGSSGVTNVLVGDASLDDVIKPTLVDNLWSVPAGPTPPNPADMLQSARFRALLDDLASRFDRVIIDSPPAVAVTDAAIISTLCDGVVFVVRAFKTSKTLSMQGLRALRDIGAPLVGVVLNAVDLNRHEYTYYHYYYYKRDGYRATPAAAAPASGGDDEVGAAPPS